mmetsp:Transcript_48822/g.113167  ORF Transcript_48822/g.113167 Transcript_48822/m.113167 type:complete len:207 (+) Transcript_48822:229-849(+)
MSRGLPPGPAAHTAARGRGRGARPLHGNGHPATVPADGTKWEPWANASTRARHRNGQLDCAGARHQHRRPRLTATVSVQSPNRRPTQPAAGTTAPRARAPSTALHHCKVRLLTRARTGVGAHPCGPAAVCQSRHLPHSRAGCSQALVTTAELEDAKPKLRRPAVSTRLGRQLRPRALSLLPMVWMRPPRSQRAGHLMKQGLPAAAH